MPIRQILIALAVLLAGCGENPSKVKPPKVVDDGSNTTGVVVVTDTETGCQYLSRHYGAIIPRVNAQGEHICK